MLSEEFIDNVIAIRVRASDSLWKGICEILLSAGNTDAMDEVLAKMPFSVNSDLFFLLRSCLKNCSSSLGWNQIGLCFSTVGQMHRREKHSPKVEIVWSGPSKGALTVRRTDQVLYDLVSEAKSDILIVTFAAARITLLDEVLKTAINRRVAVKLILEFETESEGQLSWDALNAFSLEVRKKVAIYCWPKENRERNQSGKPGKLHVKCAVVDEIAFVSSANLTDDAFNRNMELGVLIKGCSIPKEIREHFESLLSENVLARVGVDSEEDFKAR